MSVKVKNKPYEDVILENILRSTDMAIVATDLDFQILYCNPPAEKIFGYTAEEVIGKTVMEIHAKENVDPSRFESAMEIVRKEGAFQYTVEQKREDGPRFIESSVSGIRDRHNNLIGFVLMSQDATGRRRAEKLLLKTNRTLKILSECNQAMIRTSDETELMREVCRIIVESRGYRFAWVGFAVHDEEKNVCPVAQTGFEQGYLETLNIVWSDTDLGRGPTGTAIRTGIPYIARNILTDPNFAPWRDAAIQRGYASSIALPLFADKEVFGALNIYAAETDAFDTEEIAILNALAEDLSYGIATLRLRKESAGASEELIKYRKHLERLVEDRTVKLQNEITDRTRAEEALRSSLKLFHIMGTCTIDEIIQVSLEESIRLTGSKIGYFHFVNPDQESIEFYTWSNETLKYCSAEIKATHYPLDQAGVWADCVRQKKAVIHNDYGSLLHKKGQPEGHVPLIRDMGVPVFEDGRIAAVVGVGNKTQAYDTFDAEQISLLIENAWGIVQRRRSEMELQQSRLHLEDLVKERTDDLQTAVRELQQKITERDLAEKALLESEERYRRIADAIADYIYTVHVEAGRPVETKHSESCFAVTGYGIRDFKADPYLWINMVPEEDRDIVRKQTVQLLSGHSPQPVEHRIMRKDGVVRWVESTVVPNHDMNGDLISYDGIVRDITGRKHIEKELEQHREHLEKLFSERTAKLKAEISERKKAEKELRVNMEELERFSRLALGREKQMIKLKKEINEYLCELGREAKYKIVK